MNRLPILIILIIMAVVTLSAVTYENASFKDFLYGDTNGATVYDNWVTHIVEGLADPDYNLYAPWDPQTTGFGTYNYPSNQELTDWDSVIDAFVVGDTTLVDFLITQFGFPYEMVEFSDTDTGRMFFVLRENLNGDVDDSGTTETWDDEIGSFDYGWGMYVYNPASNWPIVVTVPHPNDDYITSAIGWDTFVECDARYVLFSGVGREVLWNHDGNYTNSKSLCDPTRNTHHTFSYAYVKFADEMRATFNRREFSLQIHSYDWNRHLGYPPNQISAGWGRSHPSLPIRDLSSNKIDVCNLTPEIVHPANSIGIHDAVHVTDYYGVYNSEAFFEYITDSGETLQISNHIDLTGYRYNSQGVYSCSGWSDWDVYDPFYHIEYDELPDSYYHNQQNLMWFYAYNPDTGEYDMAHLFDNARAFYYPWVVAIAGCMPALFQFDDGTPPGDIAQATHFESSMSRISLEWTLSDDYEFESYEILFDTAPLADETYSIRNRSNNANLAQQNTGSYTVSGLASGTTYYLGVRALDYNGNYSAISNEINE
ncbi:MAG: fibronectin type III domain-containing protein, partial [Candidatus Cloacimonetes bacterium]|nr:fibronectin type III domain-containing protein [Candidatus Cloacimonadota bacterium]